jgi:hypothetical protein
MKRIWQKNSTKILCATMTLATISGTTLASEEATKKAAEMTARTIKADIEVIPSSVTGGSPMFVVKGLNWEKEPDKSKWVCIDQYGRPGTVEYTAKGDHPISPGTWRNEETGEIIVVK